MAARRAFGGCRPEKWVRPVVVSLVLAAGLAAPAVARAQNPGFRLSQCENGANGIANCTGSAWVTGNAGPHSRYREGDFVPFRTEISDLVVGRMYTLRIGYDAVRHGLHAYDYLGSVDGSAAPGQQIVPCDIAGLAACGSPPTTLAVPEDTNTTFPPGGSQKPGEFRAWGAQLISAAYVNPVPIDVNTTGTVERLYDVTFTADRPTIVLAWGGHIASVLDWGAGRTFINAASGSSFHMRLRQLVHNGHVVSTGSRDLGLSASALAPRPSGFTTQVSRSPVDVGTSVYDTATLTGRPGHPVSGTVTFFVCHYATPRPCANGAIEVGSRPVVATAVMPSPIGQASIPFFPRAEGSYCFRAEFTPAPTAAYSPAAHTNDTTECLEAVEAPPPPPIDLTVTKAPATHTFVIGGDPALARHAYTLTVRNTGTVTANDVVLRDTLPPGLEFVPPSEPAGCTFTAPVVTCVIGTLDVGATAVRRITVRAALDAPLGVANNSVVAYEGETPKDNDNAEVVIRQQFNVSVEKTGPRTVVAGRPLTYTLTVTNHGTLDALVRVTDTLPPGLTATDISGEAPLDCVLATLVCTGTVPAGESRRVTVTADSSPDLERGHILVNGVEVRIECPCENIGNPTEDTSRTRVRAFARLGLTKTLVGEPPPEEIVAGETAFYQLAVRNRGPSLARNVTITDTLPPGTTFVPGSSSPECEAGATAHTVVCSVGNLRPGEAKSVLIAVAVPADASGTLRNLAIADSDTPNNRPEAEEQTPVTGETDVTIVKTAQPHPVVVAGGSIVYTLTVANTNGPSDAKNVVVTDTAPAGVTFTNAVGTGGFDCGTTFMPTVTCKLATLPKGASETITITGTVSATAAPGPIANNAVVEVDGEHADDDTVDSTIEAQTALQLTKTASSHLGTAGGPLSYTLTVTNTGPSVATGVVLTDSIPAGFVPTSVTPGAPTCTFTPTALTCHLGTIAANGGSATVTLTGTVEPSVADRHELENTATVTDDQGSSATDDESVKVGRMSSFTITKTAPSSVTAGESASWTIKVTNKGPSDFGPPAEPLSVTDAHSAFVTPTGLTSSDPNVHCSAALTCEIASLAAGKTVTITATGLVHSDASGTLANNATVETPTGPETGHSTVDVERHAKLEVTKSAPPSATAGGSVNYVITVHNHGPSDSTGTTVTDTLPAGLTFTGATPPCTAAGQHVTCAVGDLAANATATVTITARVSPDATGTLRNIAVAKADDAPPEDSKEQETDPEPDSLVSISKAADEVGTAGGLLRWTITVLNQGGSPASGATVTDTLPAGLTFVQATSTTPGVHCAGSGHHLSCTLPDIPANTRLHITLITSVAPDIVPAGRASIRANNGAVVHVEGESDSAEGPAEITPAPPGTPPPTPGAPAPGAPGAPSPAPPRPSLPGAPPFTG